MDWFAFQRHDTLKPRRCRALYDCDADREDELSFKEGEVIIIINEETDDDEWMEGVIEGQPERRGVFPSSFVHVLKEWCRLMIFKLSFTNLKALVLYKGFYLSWPWKTLVMLFHDRCKLVNTETISMQQDCYVINFVIKLLYILTIFHGKKKRYC